ncbi:MAG TPA: tetratricopeptide repeat protein, partial [Pyrinomonadaceae bacterium]|nr:tetratricopeptide repeat protein [Pyrinomonadaceae bacterium]
GKMESESSVSEQLFEKGRDAGQIALRLFPDKPHGHFWYAANLGELAQLSPITVGIKAADDIRSEMLKVIEIDPSFQGASAFDALGELELKTRLFGGSVEKAIEYLEKGVEVEPTNSNIRLHLAQAYLAAKRKDDAKKQLETIIKMPPPADYRVEHSKAVEEAKKIIEKKF